jgi:uncharacterized protein
VARRTREVARKSIFDPIHGVVVLSGPFLELIGDPAFQRLWGIRQTGLAHLVFPGANHTRLEHSLGTYWVGQAMAQAVGLPPEAAATVAAGALLHDLGHAPLSHTLDGPLSECLGVTHEARSRAIVTGTGPGRLDDPEATPSRIPEILEAHGIDPARVADLIDPPKGRERAPVLRQLLHGAIDADRIDYLQRDAHYTGAAYGAIDAARLLATVQVHRGRIAFAEKGRHAVEGFLVGRSLMYSTVYYHKTVRSAEVMAEAAVARLPGYPESARPLFAGNDGGLFAALEASGGRSAALARALTERRLYRRVHAVRQLGPEERRRYRALARRPRERRRIEDALAERVGAPPGAVLLDLAGLAEARGARSEWADLVVLEDGKETHPFDRDEPWRSMAGRPRAPWELAVYADRRFETAVRWRWRRDGGAFG